MEPLITQIGASVASVALYPGNDCSAVAPYAAYVAQQDECFNYSPQSTRYNSFMVSCAPNGAEAKVSIYARRSCVSVVKTVVVSTNNCTTTEFLGDTPMIVQCTK